MFQRWTKPKREEDVNVAPHTYVFSVFEGGSLSASNVRSQYVFVTNNNYFEYLLIFAH